MKRDHGNPATRNRSCRMSMDPLVKRRPKAPEPLPIKFNFCPSPQCGHSNIDVEKVATCRVCGTTITAIDETFAFEGAGDPAAWTNARRSRY